MIQTTLLRSDCTPITAESPTPSSSGAVLQASFGNGRLLPSKVACVTPLGTVQLEVPGVSKVHTTLLPDGSQFPSAAVAAGEAAASATAAKAAYMSNTSGLK
jgi:hypothetical protein